MTVPQAEAAARAAGGTLYLVHSPSSSPAGRIISGGPNGQFPYPVVVSSGPLRDVRAVLPLASGPPTVAECAGGLLLNEDGTVGPLFCKDGRLNVVAWNYYASNHPQVMGLRRRSSLAQIETAVCAPVPTVPIAIDAYMLANAYYGWHRPNLPYGLYYGPPSGKSCTQMGLRGK